MRKIKGEDKVMRLKTLRGKLFNTDKRRKPFAHAIITDEERLELEVLEEWVRTADLREYEDQIKVRPESYAQFMERIRGEMQQRDGNKKSDKEPEQG